MFNVIVIGGEDCGCYEYFRSKMIYYLQNKAKSGEGITIFTTGDEFVNSFTKRYHIDVKIFVTNWKDYGKDALKHRNEELIKNANAIIYFQDGKKEHQMLLDMASKNAISCRIVKAPVSMEDYDFMD